VTQVSVTSVLPFLVSKQLLETIRCEDGHPFNLNYHQKRMNKSLKTLGFKNSHNLTEHITPPDQKLYRCRIIYDEKNINIEYIPYTKRLISTLQLLQADQLEYTLKYAERNALDTLFKLKGTADDILIVQDRFITDTTIANIAFFDGRDWFTPKQPLLYGTTRARLLDENKIIEADIKPSDLDQYSAFALMNAMIGFNEIKNGIISPIKGAHDVI